MPETIEAPDCSAPELSDACLVWTKARDGTASFLAQHTKEVARRRDAGSSRGSLTDSEQDLLRAALVFAGAGLDAVVKQVLQDAGGLLISSHFLGTTEGEYFLKKVARLLRAPMVTGGEDDEVPGRQGSPVLLARLLMSDEPRTEICTRIIEEMTGGSFQSVERLREACNVFGLSPEAILRPQAQELREALDARNQIVHEMDVDLSIPNRSRRQRRKNPTGKHVKTLLQTAATLLQVADQRLCETRSEAG
jgi:hypothetical protein